jgi:hypothetical protein
MQNNDKNGFNYTYSSKEQDEVRRIREKYTPKERVPEDNISRLRRLDEGVSKKATAVSLVFGVIGILIMGFGMSIILSDIGTSLGLYGGSTMLVGIPLGIVGGALAALAYPVHSLITARERERIAPEILRLTDELMK